MTVPAAAAPIDASGHGLVLINELANGGSRSDSDTFFELRNWGEQAVDLTGWQVFRCSAQGLRSNVGRTEGDLTGVVLEPGQVFTVSKIGMVGDDHMSAPFMTSGFGLYLQNSDDELADAVGVYPNEPWTTQSECTTGANLPNSLAFAFDESWQRVSATGDVTADFVKAPATIGGPNAESHSPEAATGVVLSEFAPSGPAATDDEFVELWNLAASAVDIGGWQLYRCTATGRMRTDTLQTTIPTGTLLGPGDFYVIAASAYDGDADARYGTGFADVTAGAYLRTPDGLRAGGIAVSSYADSACQRGDTKLPAVLDHVGAESYQWTARGYAVAERTPGRAAGDITQKETFEYRDIAISEFATDPSQGDLPAGATQRNYIELGNYGSKAVDLSGWTIRRCEQTGIRSRQLQLTIADGTKLEPGDAWLAAKDGTGLAADATYTSAFNFLGAGAWIENARGERVDSIGVYAMNEMDQSNVTWSPCSKGMPLTTYQPDRWLDETFQRTRFTGVDADDFVTAPATPGVIDELPWVDPTQRVDAQPVAIEPVATEAPAALPPTARPATVLEAWGGATPTPLKTKEGEAETTLDPLLPADIADSSFKFPYLRLVLDASSLEDGSRVFWSGSGAGRTELQLSVWDGEGWRLLDAASGPEIRLGGAISQKELIENRVTLLVQAGPRTEPTLSAERDGELQDPADYDLAISHITDTQYLTESYPEVYAQLVSWIADNADARKIEFATHTGDLVQNWVDPDQGLDRATVEFERASAVQSILDEAGIPNSVLPGNHDNKRGVDDTLFNEYFGPERYEGTPWYAGSIAPGDNTSNFSTFEHEGARFLMLSLAYAYGDREIDWASTVVAEHPEYNVILSTHEHVTPKTDLEEAHISANSRWVSRGQDLWNEVIAPNRNVVLVLSGHFHGLGQIRTENAGGIEGHTVVELLADYQEFRTHTGERATGFQRLLQLDLASGSVAADTFSVRLGESASFEYDYKQFVPDTGSSNSASNARPWRIVESGLQGRYTDADDEFTATVAFQYPKLVSTTAMDVAPPVLEPSSTAHAHDYTDVYRVLS